MTFTVETIETGPEHLYWLDKGVGSFELHEIRWQVIDKLRKNVRIQSEDGAYVFRVDPAYLIPVDPERPNERPDFETPSALFVGDCVFFRGREGVYVVTGVISLNRYRIVKLGGEDNLYWKANRASLTPINLKEVTEYLVDHL
jgi:hypothetical protein